MATNEQYRYKLISTGDSSAKYGNCEVCGKHCTEVFNQVEERSYEPILPDEKSETCWTHYQCHDLFGHEECLISKRREAHLVEK